MGADIWFFVEKKVVMEYEQQDSLWMKIVSLFKETKPSSIWLSADKWRVKPYYHFYPKGNFNRFEPIEGEFYDEGRNYVLYSVLSNTRNDYNVPYISLPRGVPADISPELAQVVSRDKNAFYDHSWLLLSELLAYNWDQQYNNDQYMEVENVKNTCSWFINETIPKLKNLGDPEDVRIIFWYG